LGRLLKRGLTQEQTFTLVREASTPGLLWGLLSLTEEREEPLKLRDETVQARRFRYQTKELGYPRERARGKLWLGPQGELLQSELLPQQSAVAALALEKNNPVFTLTCTNGVQRRAEQGPQGWSVTHSDKSFEAELDFDRRLLRFTSRQTGSVLSATWDGLALRYAYPSVLPTSLSVPKDGNALFLASLLLPEPLPGLVRGQKRPILLLPLVTGEALALEGELTRLPDTPKKLKSYRLTLDGGITATLESDARGLVRLTSNSTLAITRKQ
jgi:hypothetical protein